MRDYGAQVRREIGVHLRRLRSSLGWTLDEVADKASLNGIPVSASTVSRVERGLTSVPAEALSALCDSLGSSLAYIEEIVRSAASSEELDLTGWDDTKLMEAATDAATKGQVRRALMLLQAAHDWLLMQEDEVDRSERLADVLTWEAACYRRLHSFSRAQSTAARVLNMDAVSTDLKLHAVLLHVEVGYITGDFYRATIYAEHAKRLLSGVTERTRAFAEAVLGMLLFEQDKHDEAIPHLEASRDVYQQLECEIEVTRTSVTLGYCHFALGRPQGGRRLVRDARQRAERAGYGEVLVYALTTEGRMNAKSGELDKAAQLLKDAAFRARDLDLPTQEFIAWYTLWKAQDAAAGEAELEKTARKLRKLLRRVPPAVPEAREFLEAETERRSRDRRADS